MFCREPSILRDKIGGAYNHATTEEMDVHVDLCSNRSAFGNNNGSREDFGAGQFDMAVQQLVVPTDLSLIHI